MKSLYAEENNRIAASIPAARGASWQAGPSGHNPRRKGYRGYQPRHQYPRQSFGREDAHMSNNGDVHMAPEVVANPPQERADLAPVKRYVKVGKVPANTDPSYE
jgi:hypothetical protein